MLLSLLARGNIGGAIASVAVGTPPPTAPPLGKGRMENVAVLEIQQLVPNGQLEKGAMPTRDWNVPFAQGVWGDQATVANGSDPLGTWVVSLAWLGVLRAR
ncbi:MAG: hypothetical protein AAFY20_07120 [Cyanobacteria bacterium J06639_14]